MSIEAPGRGSLAAALESVAAASAAPYGYTISIWSTGALLMHAHGMPDVLDVLLFVLGAISGFVVVGLTASALPAADTLLGQGSERVVAGMLNWLGVGAAVGSVALLAELHSRLGWALGSLAATTLYLVGASIQLALVERRRHMT
jgi:hypothetical protein